MPAPVEKFETYSIIWKGKMCDYGYCLEADFNFFVEILSGPALFLLENYKFNTVGFLSVSSSCKTHEIWIKHLNVVQPPLPLQPLQLV